MEVVWLACEWCVAGVWVPYGWHGQYCKDAMQQSFPDGSLRVSLRGLTSDLGRACWLLGFFNHCPHAPGTAWGLAAREVSVLSQITQ